MTVRTLFATPFYEGKLKNAALVADLDRSCQALAEDDRAGRAWSKAHGYRGYTSYASLNDLPMRDPAFAVVCSSCKRENSLCRDTRRQSLSPKGSVVSSSV